MASASKERRKADRAIRAQARDAAQAEIMTARMRTFGGYVGAYVGVNILPEVFPTLKEHETTVDLATAGVGGYFALTDAGPMGDYGVGVAAVGASETLNKVVATIAAWLSK
jgi:hypothetical protein